MSAISFKLYLPLRNRGELEGPWFIFKSVSNVEMGCVDDGMFICPKLANTHLLL